MPHKSNGIAIICQKCGFVWLPRVAVPKVCAKCKNPFYWLSKFPGRGRPKKGTVDPSIPTYKIVKDPPHF
jgi:hypothetical protein